MKNTIAICITILIVAVIGYVSLNKYLDWKTEQNEKQRVEDSINNIIESSGN